MSTFTFTSLLNWHNELAEALEDFDAIAASYTEDMTPEIDDDELRELRMLAFNSKVNEIACRISSRCITLTKSTADNAAISLLHAAHDQWRATVRESCAQVDLNA